jgi:hypothetical protein
MTAVAWHPSWQSGSRAPDPHWLNAADAERSKARVADIELGLSHPEDGWYWRVQAQTRVTALEQDQPIYGLLQHEVDELAALKALLAKALADG